MRHTILILIISIFSTPVVAQNLPYQDSAGTDCKYYQGKLPATISENASYIYCISKYNSFIELSAVTWGSLVTKYRVERQSNGQTYIVTKTVENRISSPSTSTSFIAIDSGIYNALQVKEDHFKYLEEQHICIAINPREPIFLRYFSGFIAEHDLKDQFVNFNPDLFVAWLRIKNKEKITF